MFQLKNKKRKKKNRVTVREKNDPAEINKKKKISHCNNNKRAVCQPPCA